MHMKRAYPACLGSNERAAQRAAQTLRASLSLHLFLHISLKAGSKRRPVLDHRGGVFACCLLDALVKMGLGPPASMLNPSMTGKTENLHERVVSPDTSEQWEAN